ncbi:uncharacterized protein LOC101739983 [Bombyx mori]|uniref:Uncharacterized protein n=1 Tax=Bombyx mori TaxID=7091 RepID=A0A8R2APF4_BOMMO|nr:uncharacterized protein LOC101739983 [Bombyx mori]
MGCVCCSLSSFVSIILDALERVSLWTVCAMLTCCLMLTILTVTIMGIGIGYHYCFVQSSVDAMAQAAKAAGSLRSGSGQGPVLRSIDKAVKRGFAHRVERRDVDNPPPTNNITDFYQNYTSVFNSTNSTKFY